MSKKVEHLLLSSIIDDDQGIRRALRCHVKPEYFQDEDHREVYEWLLAQHLDLGVTPSIEVVNEEFPDFEERDYNDDLSVLAKQVCREGVYAQITEALGTIAETAKGDPYKGLEVFRETMSELSSSTGGSVEANLVKTGPEILRDYDAMVKMQGQLGLPYKHKYLNDLLCGKQPEDLIGVYGRMKSMKTWYLLMDALHTHEYKNVNVIVFSCEMSLVRIQRRVACCIAELPWSAFRKGKLTRDERAQLEDSIESMQDSAGFHVIQVEERGPASLEFIRAKIEEHDAQVAYVDGAYYLMREESHKEFRVITSGLKKLVAEKCKIPVVMSTQANRKGVAGKGRSTEELAFGDSLAQDCDALFRILREKEHIEAHEAEVIVQVARDADPGSFTITTDLCTDMEQKEVTNDPESNRDEEDDGDDPDAYA